MMEVELCSIIPAPVSYPGECCRFSSKYAFSKIFTKYTLFTLHVLTVGCKIDFCFFAKVGAPVAKSRRPIIMLPARFWTLVPVTIWREVKRTCQL